MSNREQLEQWDRDHVWHPFTPMQAYAAEPPLIIERRRRLLPRRPRRPATTSTASRRCGATSTATASPRLDAAVREQLDAVAHSTLLGLSNVPAIRLARRLVELAPPGLTRVFYSDDGATAVEVALKMAFQYWRQRPDAAAGQDEVPRPAMRPTTATRSATSASATWPASTTCSRRCCSRPLRAPSPYCYRCPLGLERVDAAASTASTTWPRWSREHADELAAVVIEPLVQGAAGMIVAPEGYLRRVREVTRQHDVLLIADEVAVGFGRTGTLFACAQEDVAPDFLCLAKGLTGGYLPLAATLTTDEVYQCLSRPAGGRTDVLPRPHLHRQPARRRRRPRQSRPADRRRRAGRAAGQGREAACAPGPPARPARSSATCDRRG